MLIRAPGVYRPQADTWLLADAMADAGLRRGGQVLDVCTGTGALAIRAGLAGASSVTAVDISGAALLSAWLNARMRGISIELLHGNFARVLWDRRFDLVVANPPYVPATEPSHGAARAWDAGSHGRAVLDRLSAMLPNLLNRNGVGLLVQSAICDPDRTLTQLRCGGLKAAVVARSTIPFGPVMRGRARRLTEMGLISPGQCHEELVVIRADRTRP